MSTSERRPLRLAALMASISVVRGQLTTANSSTGPITTVAPNLEVIEFHNFPSVWNTTYTTDTYTVSNCDAVGNPGTRIDCTWDIDPYGFWVYEPITTTTFTDPAAYSSFSSSIRYPDLTDISGYVPYTSGQDMVTLYSYGDPGSPAPLKCCNDLIQNPDIRMSYIERRDTPAYTACPTIIIHYLGPFAQDAFLELPPGSRFGDDWKPFITGSSCTSVITGLATTKTPVIIALKTAEDPVASPTSKPDAGSTANPGPSETNPPTTDPTTTTTPTIPPPQPTDPTTEPTTEPTVPPTTRPSAPSNTNPPVQNPSPSPPQQSPNPQPPSQNPPQPTQNPSPPPTTTTQPQPQQPGNTQVVPVPPPAQSSQPPVPNPVQNPPVVVTTASPVTVPTFINGIPTQTVSDSTTSFAISTGVSAIDTTVNGVPTQIESTFTNTFAIIATTSETTIETTINGVPTEIISTFTTTELVPSVGPAGAPETTAVSGTTGYTINPPEPTGLIIHDGSGVQSAVSKSMLGFIMGISMLAILL